MSDDDEDDKIPHPRKNPRLEGHEAAEALVARAWESGRFPHAWLICGPRGVGKATFAYRMARWILAGGGQGDAGGGGLFGADEMPIQSLALSPESGTFRRIVSGGHADFRALERPEGKTAIPVDNVRALLSFVHQTPAESAWKAIVIDSADELNRNGANAILKVLEEPPAHTVFLLVSHAPGRLLPTIRSRCRKLALTGLSDETMLRLLADYEPELGAEDARLLTRMS